MKKWLLTVQRRDDTRWHVCDSGFPTSLASFGRKDDAIEYARQLAGSWEAANTGADEKIGRSAVSQQSAHIGVHA